MVRSRGLSLGFSHPTPVVFCPAVHPTSNTQTDRFISHRLHFSSLKPPVYAPNHFLHWRPSLVYSELNALCLVCPGGTFNQGSNRNMKSSLHHPATQALHYSREFSPEFDTLQTGQAL